MKTEWALTDTPTVIIIQIKEAKDLFGFVFHSQFVPNKTICQKLQFDKLLFISKSEWPGHLRMSWTLTYTRADFWDSYFTLSDAFMRMDLDDPGRYHCTYWLSSQESSLQCQFTFSDVLNLWVRVMRRGSCDALYSLSVDKNQL